MLGCECRWWSKDVMDRLLRSTSFWEVYMSKRKQKMMWLYSYWILFISLYLFQSCPISQTIKTHFWHLYSLKTSTLFFIWLCMQWPFFPFPNPSRLKSVLFWIFTLVLKNLPCGLFIVDLTRFRFKLIFSKLWEASLPSLADQKLPIQLLYRIIWVNFLQNHGHNF